MDGLQCNGYISKGLYGLISNVGGTRMKRIIILLAIVLATILMTLSLQSCFIPYHDRDDRGDNRGDHRGDPRGDRDGRGDRGR